MPERRAARLSRLAAPAISLAILLAGAGAAWSATPVKSGKPSGGAGSAAAQSQSAQSTAPNSKVAASRSKPKGKSKKPAHPPPPPPTLLATLGDNPAFPERALGLWPSNSAALSAAQVHVTENGAPIAGLTLSSLRQPGTRQFGVVLLIDQSTAMSGDSIGQSVSAARSIAGRLTGTQELGITTFSARPSILLAPTVDPRLINQALSLAPALSPGHAILPALGLAYDQLQQAHVATGAVILLTDSSQGLLTSQAAAAAAAGLRMGFRTLVVGVKDATFSTQTRSALQSLDRSLVQAAPSQLPQALTALWGKLTSGYVAEYRSAARPGAPVATTVSADGFPKALSLTYTAPRPRPATPPPPLKISVPPLSQLAPLARYPLFAVPVQIAHSAKPRPSSFWSSTTSVALVAVICALLLGVALALLLNAFGSTGVEQRVAGFFGEYVAESGAEAAPTAVRARVPSLLARRRWWPRFVVEADVARMRHSPVSLVKRSLAGSLAAAMVLMVVLNSPAGLFLGLPIGPFVLFMMVRRAARLNRQKFGDNLPSHLQDMAGALRGGRSLPGSILAVIDGADQPILGEFERAVADEQLGRPLEESMNTIAQRMHSEDMEQVALIATLHKRSGSSIAEALEHVADGARERAELRRELRSLTGQARLTSRVLTALPVVLLLIMLVIDPNYVQPLFNSVGGILMLILSATMITIGWAVMRRITNVEA